VNFLLGSIFELHADAVGTRPLEEDFEDAGTLVDGGAVFLGVLQQQRIEFAAADLPGLRALVRFVVPEVEGFGKPALLVHELDAVLLHEVAVAQLGEHAQPFEHPIGLRDQRLADVEAGEVVALKELDAVALLGDERGDGRSGRPSADDDDICLLRDHVAPCSSR
jgi:hypothetical protein